MTDEQPDRPVAVCTIVRGRQTHLRNLLVGLTRQTRRPDVVVVAVMGGTPPHAAADGLDLPLEWIDVSDSRTPLPLAGARNAAVARARRSLGGEVPGHDGPDLVLLDVDVIPAAGLVAAYADRCGRTDAIWSGHVEYLPAGAAAPGWTEASLADAGRAHPARPRPAADEPLPRPELFWSLSFAAPAAVWDALDGFDEAYVGYGAEDTDLGLRADAAGIPLLRTPAAVGWHQHHDSRTPPVQHLTDIVRNARTFHQRWGRWPMEGWLREMADDGLIDWEPDGTALTATAAGEAARAAAA